MANKKGGLGRGIDQLFIENSAEELSSSGAVSIPIGDIEPDKSQPRSYFDEDALSELADSILEYGVLQPLLVRPMYDGSYRIVAGERRWRAARKAGLNEVPVIIRSFTDTEASAVALIENLQREDLNAIEEAAGIRRLMDEFGFTQEAAAEKLSKSRSAIANSLRLLALPADVSQFVTDGLLSAGHARTLLGLNDKNLISELAKTVMEKELSVRDTEELVKSYNKVKKAPGTKKKRDKFYDEVELALSGVLARKVSIRDSRKGGKIEIEYFDDDDLKKLASMFKED